MTDSPWKIWIDTGGTFTDCIAVDPEGNIHREKVLTKSALRGKIEQIIGPDSFSFSSSWKLGKNILKDYIVKISGEFPLQGRIKSVDIRKGVIYLDQNLLRSEHDQLDFEITANEEAPVLATRLVTLTALGKKFPPIEMRLGSTIGTNALLERKGAKVTLFVTEGFGDLLLIGNQQRPDIFSLDIEKPSPLYNKVVEVKERLNSKGHIDTELTPRELSRIAELAGDQETESVAISFVHSYLNRKHEIKTKNRLKQEGYNYVTSSAEIAPLINYLNRTETAVVNAYLAPKVQRYLNNVRQKLSEGNLRVMTSAGGMVDFKYFLPKDSLFSGPAGGVVGAVSAAKRAGLNKIISFDMGGTSTDVARFDGKYDYQYETKIGDSVIVSPSLTIETVASGGGSICSYDGMKFSVGPESAGSTPGPACYGEGGPLTITDVNLLLGRLIETNFGIPVNRKQSEKAFESLIPENKADSFRRNEILKGFLQIANEKMASAIRRISVNKGFDPSEYTMIPFGGAGGQHALDLAEMLDMKKVLIPYDASLLSAMGMGDARIERFSVLQVLKPFDQVKKELDSLIHRCSEEAIAEIRKEGLEENEVEISEILFYMRFRGQETSLEVVYKDYDLIGSFREAYKKIYGHWLKDRIVEIESIKVIAAEKIQEITPSGKVEKLNQAKPSDSQRVILDREWENVPVFTWEDLSPGDRLGGPALLTSRFTTVVIKERWSFYINNDQQAVFSQVKKSKKDRSGSGGDQQSESVELELFTNRFTAIAEEMGALLRRTSFSVNIKERLDYSCALLDRHGELIVNAPHIPVHLGGLGICVRSVMKSLHLKSGDVVITNHPAFGGSHLPDITLIAPVHDVNNQLIGFVANRAHHAELGGKRPGSMPPDARNLAEEGLVIQPVFLAREGEVFWDKIRNILLNPPFPSRNIHENMADLNGALASIYSGVNRLRYLAENYSSEKVVKYMKALKEYAHERTMNRISGLKSDEYFAKESLDDGSAIQVKIKIEPHELNFDFEGSSKIHPGNLNATPAIVRSVIIYVLRLLIDEPIPLNEGIMRNVTINLPRGFLNPEFPADPEDCPAVVGGNTETSQRLVDTLLKAFKMAACSQGTMNNFLFGNSKISYYETICGGVGASEGHPGASAVHQHMTNTRITDPEILEFRYPVKLNLFRIRENSGGKGKWNGGDGVIRQMTFLEPMEVTILSQHRKVAPYGLGGGGEGQKGEQFLLKPDGTQIELKGIDAISVSQGDIIEIKTPGGGGWGGKNSFV